ncbi:MAG: hypothetical protein WA004_02215 [Saprospiraceae bacterium]
MERLICSVEVLFDTWQVEKHNVMLCLKCTFSLLKKYQKNKAVAALPKTGLHFAGLAKLAQTVEGRLCFRFAQAVASLQLVFRRWHAGGGFIPAGFLTANRLRPDGRPPVLLK